MKRLLLIVLMLTLLTACGKDKVKTAQAPSTTPPVEDTNPPEENTTINTKEVAEEDNIEETEVGAENASTREIVSELIENSDYISRVRVIESDAGRDVKFLEDYKSDLSTLVIELPKSLRSNTEYIVFYKNSPNGEIVPTNDNSFMEVAQGEDSTLKYIEETFEGKRAEAQKIKDAQARAKAQEKNK